MSDDLVDIGTLKGASNEKQRKTQNCNETYNEVFPSVSSYPKVINNKLHLDNCTAEDLDDGILGKFADWLVKNNNTKISNYTVHDQYVSQFKTLLEEDPLFRAKVNEWTFSYSKVRTNILSFHQRKCMEDGTSLVQSAVSMEYEEYKYTQRTLFRLEKFDEIAFCVLDQTMTGRCQ